MSELLKINVNAHTEKKGQLTYLSWAWAWAEVLKIDPQASWVPMSLGPDSPPWMVLPDGSMMVGVQVTIKGHAKQSMLPVMDNRNKAIKNPDAFAVNTALMRCLAKAIAMHGLGLYIYAGEDLPEGAERPPTREEIVHACADAAIAKFSVGDEFGAYEEVSGITDNEEKLMLWSYLGKEHSALRACIKRMAEEERNRQAQLKAA
jgi:hypothetical protein